MSTGLPGRRSDAGAPAITPRLLNLKQAAAYLGVSFWSVRDWSSPATCRRSNSQRFVRARVSGRRTLRRKLIDRADLDAFIEHQKGGSAPDIQCSAPLIQVTTTGRHRADVLGVCPSQDER
jgi:hypothetical protein